MFVLVDWDNYVTERPTRSIASLLSDVIGAIPVRTLLATEDLSFRIYGGWFFESALTPAAQQVAAGLSARVPFFHSVREKNKFHRIMINGELAFGVLADKGRVFEHTYRKRRIYSGAWCENPAQYGCANSTSCGMSQLVELFDSKRCGTVGCPVRMHHVLRKNEQKLVDTMIAVDLQYLAAHGEKSICVVSSDDDIWPAIVAALREKASVLQLKTKSGDDYVSAYTKGIGRQFESVAI